MQIEKFIAVCVVIVVLGGLGSCTLSYKYKSEVLKSCIEKGMDCKG